MPARLSVLIITALVFGAGQAQQRNVWEQQYRQRSAEDMAAQFESDSRPVFRHRMTIVRLLQLTPGQSAAEIGAGSGFLSRLMAADVGPVGRVIATELDAKMVTYMNARAAAEGLPNLRAIVAPVTHAGLESGSQDAIVIVNTYSFFDQPRAMMRSIADALKPDGRLVVVDFPASRGDGIDPEAVRTTARDVGLAFVDRSDVIPGHFALRFRKSARAPVGRPGAPRPDREPVLRTAMGQ